ncbi:MAG: DNA mismatch repair protein MutS [Endomicrobium sp.]|jgi:DNA mismatch repair protein MutS|nr:DNA mismatch repair protein MutS [Endomicrobium sp.]
MEQYWDIKVRYSNMVLFFRLGDFYEMFSDDAVKVAPILEIVLTQRNGVPMCGVPYHSANSYIIKLITKGFKVAICEQLEIPGNIKGIVKRGVTKVITPGTILDDVLLESKENNFLMSLFIDDDLLPTAFAVADISTGVFFTSEITLKSIETEISKYNPGELIVSSVSMRNKSTSDFLAKFKIPVSDVSDSFFSVENAKRVICDVFGYGALEKFNLDLDKEEMVCACGALLAYIKEVRPRGVSIFLNIKYINNSNFMYLDSVAIKNLELFNSILNKKTANSLLSVVDSTKTPMGARTIRQWLIRPLLDILKIEARQSVVKFFMDNSGLRKKIIEKLELVSDVERIIARITSGNTNPKDMIALKYSLKVFSDISEIIKCGNLLDFYIPDNTQVIDKISLCLSEDPSVSLKVGNVIKSGFDDELDELRRISADTKFYMSNLEIKERSLTGISNLKIGYTSVFGYYIEISKSNIVSVPKHYIRKQTVTAGERYITEELKTLEEKILSAQEKILRLESNIFNTLRLEISVFSSSILKASQIISEIDIFCGFASSALEYNYSCPKISCDMDLSIEGGRHPVLERVLKSGEFTANDISFKDGSSIMILTGPNMSGKSTYLRQTALIVIMAQIGSFVPAYSAKIGLVDRIFTRIGAGDNLAGGESTFMVEMTETANILNQYTERSLIILDEVGRGTSTYDGIAIAWAIIEFFAEDKKESKVLFATHYFELTGLSNVFKGVVNYNVSIEEWDGKVVFLHKIVQGSADKSYGIYVAKIAGIPRQIIEKAYKILKKLEINSINQKSGDNLKFKFFSTSKYQILEELKNVNIKTLNPMKALNLLYAWKKRCE